MKRPDCEHYEFQGTRQRENNRRRSLYRDVINSNARFVEEE